MGRSVARLEEEPNQEMHGSSEGNYSVPARGKDIDKLPEMPILSCLLDYN